MHGPAFFNEDLTSAAAADEEASRHHMRVAQPKKEEDLHGNVIMNKLRAHLNNDLSSL